MFAKVKVPSSRNPDSALAGRGFLILEHPDTLNDVAGVDIGAHDTDETPS
jgi:hypothetical protein